MTSRLNFFFTEALRSLTTNISTSVSAILTMLMALLLVGVFLVMLFFVRNTAAGLEEQADRVQVFIESSATEDDVNALRSQLEGMPEVQEVVYVSKADALNRAEKLFKDNPEVLENLPGNPFPASLEADLKDSRDVKEVASRVDAENGVMKVEYGGSKIERLIRVARFTQYVAFGLAAFLVIAATGLISNTVKLSIVSRRREIEVMKLVGASNMFVRLPFVIEGFIAGMISAISAILLMLAFRTVIANAVSDLRIGGGSDVPYSVIFLAMLGMGVLLGGVASALTIRKYLRV